MIIFLQMPITDIRKFLPEETGVLAKPIWPSPKPYSQFVRSFGQVERRGKGGADGWVGENEICDAHNALKLKLHIPPFKCSQGNIYLKCAARHFFFDGLAVGKLVLVLTTLPISIQLNKGELEELLDYILGIPASLRFPDDQLVKSDLYSIRVHLSKFYMYASSKTQKSDELIDKRWIIPGEPLVFCELLSDEQAMLKGKTNQIHLKEKQGLDKHDLIITQQWMQRGNRRVQVLLSQHLDASDLTRQKSRLLRMYLMRLHAEYESVRDISSLVLGKVIVPKRGTPESDAFQHYLNQTTKKISKATQRAQKVGKDYEISDLAFKTMDQISPGERENLIAMLKQYKIRPQITAKVDNLIATHVDVEKVERIDKVEQVGQVEQIERVENMTVNQNYQTQTWEKVIVYLAGLLFIGLIGYLVIRNEPIADPNFVVFIRIILSILTAAMGATIPGMLNVGFNKRGFLIRASGALALFVITYLLTPTVLK